MFEHFTFGAVATSYYQPNQGDREISPSDCSLPSPVSPPPTFQSFPQVVGSEEDIISRFAQQTLQPDEAEHERPQKSFCMMDEQDGFSPEELSFVSTTRGMTMINANTPPLPNNKANGGCRRLKRQMNMQLQSSSSHIKDINALVEDMIVSESQCVLRQSTSRSQLGSPPPSRGRDEDILSVDMTQQSTSHRLDEPVMIEIDEDEGFAEIEDDLWGIEEEMSLRRASTPSGIRKYSGLRWRRSFETVGLPSSTGVPARMKVRSVPRMRRRKPKTVPE